MMVSRFLKPITLPGPADWGILILRLGVSLLMMTHGYAKLGNYLNGDKSFADPIGLGEELSLLLAIGAELFCSLLVLVGLATRAALIPLIITMVVVILIVHGNDPFADKEHAVLFLVPYITILLTGPGRFSVDKRLFK